MFDFCSMFWKACLRPMPGGLFWEITHRKKCQMVCKPGSVTLLPALATIHLERLLPAASSNLPGHDAGSHLNGTPFVCPYMVLLRMGFTMPVLLPDRRCALTAPFHPYHGTPWRYLFCGTFPRVTPAGRYPAS